jgi:hypothetical protein
VKSGTLEYCSLKQSFLFLDLAISDLAILMAEIYIYQ